MVIGQTHWYTEMSLLEMSHQAAHLHSWCMVSIPASVSGSTNWHGHRGRSGIPTSNLQPTIWTSKDLCFGLVSLPIRHPCNTHMSVLDKAYRHEVKCFKSWWLKGLKWVLIVLILLFFLECVPEMKNSEWENGAIGTYLHCKQMKAAWNWKRLM